MDVKLGLSLSLQLYVLPDWSEGSLVWWMTLQKHVWERLGDSVNCLILKLNGW